MIVTRGRVKLPCIIDVAITQKSLIEINILRTKLLLHCTERYFITLHSQLCGICTLLENV